MTPRSLMLLALLGSPSSAWAADVPPVPESLLGQLVGTWEVTGTIQGEPITQDLDAHWTLGRRFVELHFTGRAPMGEGEPPYEARIFLGWDPREGRFVGHWLDVFGAGFSEPVGHGRVQDGAIVMVYPYPKSAFRNTLRFDAKGRRWRLLIERQQPDGTWVTFADEAFAPSGAR